MPKKEIPITVTNYIIVDGISRREDEYTENNTKKMFSEMDKRTMLKLGYTPVKTA